MVGQSLNRVVDKIIRGSELDGVSDSCLLMDRLDS